MGLFDGFKKKKNNKEKEAESSSNVNTNNNSSIYRTDKERDDEKEVKDAFDDFAIKFVEREDASIFCLTRMGNFNGNCVKCGAQEIFEMFTDVFLDYPEVMDTMEKAIASVKMGIVTKKNSDNSNVIKNNTKVEAIVKAVIERARKNGHKVIDAQSEREKKIDDNNVEDILNKIKNDANHEEKQIENENLNGPTEVNDVDLDKIRNKRKKKE